MKRVIALIAAFGMAVAAVPFTNEILAGDTLARNAMQSEGFQTGIQGWRIERNGNAEFNDVTVRGEFVTGVDPNARWELSSTHSNEMRGFPPDNVNNPNPGVLSIGSQQVQVSPERYLYETLLTSPYSSLVPNAAGLPNPNPKLRLTAHENTGQTGAQLEADFVRLQSTGAHWLNVDDSANPVQTTDVIDLLVSGTPETWHNLTLVNSWATLSGLTPQYRLNAAGDVTLRGRLSAGTTGVIATLPVGYRPTQLFDTVLKSNGDASSVSWLQVSTAGVITVVGNVAAAQTWLTLNFTFSARS